MLDNLSYNGYELISSSYELKKKPEGEGYYKYSCSIEGEVKFEKELSQQDEHLNNLVTLEFSSFAHGFAKGDDSPVFKLDAKFILSFDLDKDLFMDESYIRENEWFFLNFGAVASKTIMDSIFSNTTLKGTFIPAHRLLKED